MSFVPLSALLSGSAPAARPQGLPDFSASRSRRGGTAAAAHGLVVTAFHDDARRIDGEQRAIDARARRRWRDPLQYRVDHAEPGTRAAAALQQAARLAARLRAGPVRGVALVEADGAVVLLIAAPACGEDDRCHGVQLLAVADVGDRPAAELDRLRPDIERMLVDASASLPTAAGLPAPTVQLVFTTSAAPAADPSTALAWALTPAYASAQSARGRARPHRHRHPHRQVQEKH